MSSMTNHKKIAKFLRFQINRFSNTLCVIERERERLREQGYYDIRGMFAPMEYIEDVVTLDCDQGCITVQFCFGTIENSPVDGYSLVQIDEIHKFVTNKLRFNELKMQDLELAAKKERQHRKKEKQAEKEAQE